MILEVGQIVRHNIGDYQVVYNDETSFKLVNQRGRTTAVISLGVTYNEEKDHYEVQDEYWRWKVVAWGWGEYYLEAVKQRVAELDWLSLR